MSYIPNTDSDRAAMLGIIGAKTVDELFSPIPEAVFHQELRLPPGLSELEVSRKMRDIAERNVVYKTCFRGAGAYRHYIPAAVRRITANESFLTAYTPYQAEISQGILQSIFEYQTMICELVGMDVSNASVYDGASAAAEAVNMCRSKNRQTVYVSEAVHPQVAQTIRTYCFGYGIPVKTVPLRDGVTDGASLEGIMATDSDAACFYMQQPNFFGQLEDIASCAETVHKYGALLVAGCNPLSLGLLESPGKLGADIACGEGQPLGIPLGFGGPYLGFMACKQPLMRKLPGRIVGETTDAAGQRAFVLTLQAREQHIRREKASSNLCSNEAHCALTAAVYLAVMGPEGLAEASRQCHAKAVYAAGRLAEIPGFELALSGEFFNEFVTHCPDIDQTLDRLAEEDILGGLPIKTRSGEGILWAVTELNTKEEIDLMAEVLHAVAL